MIWAGRLGLVAGVLAAWTLVDPRLAALGPWFALVCLGALVRLASGGLHFRLLPALVGTFAGVIAATGYNLEADTVSYMASVTSLIQDLDFDIGNQKVAWGFPPSSRGPAGMTITPHPVGNAFVWVLPVLLGHLYALLAGVYPTNFFSPPYFGAVILTNLVLALSGALALARILARSFGGSTAALAVMGALLGSPMLYYLAVQPVMIHGAIVGLTCWAIVLLVKAVETDRAAAWRGAGLVLGLATLCRFQAVVLFVLFPLFAWTTPRIFLRRALAFAVPAIIAILPQLVVSMNTFGRPLAVPQGDGFMDWASPHWADTLISADRGLFSWHPVLIAGLLGLTLVRGPFQRMALGGLVVFVLTTWINGGVRDFNGGDAFGGRRYDLVIPFFAPGLAALIAAVRPFLVARPLALPALLFGLAAVWNLSFMAAYRAKEFKTSAPFADLAARQASRVHQLTRQATDWMGPGVRFRVYDAFVGLYTYRNFRPGGDFDLATLEPRFVGSGWSEVQGWDDGTLFRYALFPGACIVIPIEQPFDLQGYVLARAPARIKDQRISLFLNGRLVAEAGLPATWTEVPFVAPASTWMRGENEFCARLAKRRPGDEGDDLSYAAAVAKIQLP